MRGWRAFCASACFSLVAACSRGEGAGTGVGARADGTFTALPERGRNAGWGQGAGADSGATVAGTSTNSGSDAAADAYLTARPTRAKSVGHTSLVFKVTLEGGLAAAYKPRSRKPLGDRRYRAEIAAYRLARALGLDNVPRAEARSFDARDLRAACALGGAEGVFDDEALVDADGRVRGALVPWIDKYRVMPLEQPAWRAKWTAWLTDPSATVPDDQRALARSISTMIVFDYVTANWDRWSGANVAVDDATGTLLFVDNDGAFYETPPADSLARQLALVKRVVRFSRSFVGTLRALDEAKLRAVIGDESPGSALLSDAVLAAAAKRMRSALEAVDARGESALLFD
jgi:hypothetical protein